MGTKIEPGDFDCYAAAAPEEPIFTLRANDPLAPAVVRTWTVLYTALKFLTGGGWVYPRHRAKIGEAWRCARSMRRWRKTSKAKEP